MTFFIKSFYSVRKLFLPCFFEAGVYCIDYVVVEYEFRFGGRGDFAQKIAFYRVFGGFNAESKGLQIDFESGYKFKKSG